MSTEDDEREISELRRILRTHALTETELETARQALEGLDARIRTERRQAAVEAAELQRQLDEKSSALAELRGIIQRACAASRIDTLAQGRA